MATLTGTKIKDTYDGLLKVSDNVGLNSTKKIITDGLGNNSSVKISTSDFEVGGFFYVDIDGNLPDSKIGIGTSSPSETLHVVGDFRLTARFYDGSNSAGLSGRVLMSTGSATSWSNTFTTAMTFDAGVVLNAGIKDYAGSTGTAGQVLSSTGSADVEWVSLSEIQGVDGSGTANYIPIWTDSDTLGNSVIYQLSSNIGIGTVSPGAYKLNVFGEFKLNSDGSGYMQSDYGDHKISIYDGSNNEVVIFQDLDGSSANQLVVASTGVGINVANPSEKLHVVGDALITGDSHADAFKPAVTANPIKFKNFASTELARITDAGLFGIGTTSPAVKLEVNGGTSVSAFFKSLSNTVPVSLFTTNNAISTIGFKGLGSTSEYHVRVGTNVNDFVAYTNNTEKMRLTQTGRLGIGTTNPQNELHVVGSARLTGTSNLLFEGTSNVIYYPKKLVTNGQQYFSIEDNGESAEILRLNDTGALKLNLYGDGTFTGTATYKLAVDTDGNVIEIPVGSGSVDGSGTANTVTMWSDADTLTDAPITISSNDATFAGNINTNGDITIDNSSGDPFLKLKTTAKQFVLRIDQSDNEKFQIRDVSNSATRFTINNSGNVGIGTTSPSQDLTLYEDSGDANFLISSNNGASQIFFGDTESDNIGKIDYDHSNDSLNVVVNSAERMRITSNGNVGIGTTSPASKLHLYDGDFRITGVFPRIYLQDSNNDSDFSIINGNGNLRFYDDTNASDRLYISASGNVGIGTNAPARNLHVHENDSTLSYIQITNDTTGTGGGDGVSFGITSDEIAIWNNRENTDLTISTNNTERMRITSAGNVGIGTTSPDSLLHVAADVSGANAGTITIEGRPTGFLGDNIATIDFHNYGNKRSDIRMERGNTATDSQIVISTSDAGTLTDRFVIKEDGKTQLNAYGSGTFTGTATQRLAVDNAGNIIEVPIGSGAVDGSGTANTVTMWSDVDTLTDAPITISSNDATFAGKIKTTSTSTGAIEIDGGTGVSTTGAFILRQNGDNAGNGMAITSSHATSHRIWKDSLGTLNIGSSAYASSFKQDTTGNLTIIGNITNSGLVTSNRTGSSSPNSGNTNFYAVDTRSYNSGEVGGSIVLSGKYNNGGAILSGAPFVKGYKVNNTDGDYGFGIKLGVRENGSASVNTALTIDSTSNATFVGNITLPQNKYIYFDNTAHYIRRGSSNVEIQGYNGISLRTNANTRLLITQTGEIGIGNTSPNSYYANANNLVVGSHTGSNGISILSASDQTGWLVFADSSMSGGDSTRGAVAYNHDNNSMTLRVNNAGLMTLKDSKVGIGTTAPGKPLDVLGDIRSIDSNSNNHQLRATQVISYGTDAILNAQSSGDDVRLNTQSTTRLIATAGGDVGIGTTPHTVGNTWRSFFVGSSAGIISRQAASGTDAIFSNNYYINSSNLDKRITTGGASRIFINQDVMRFQRSASDSTDTTISWSESMRISSDGNVGIGTTSPDVRLEVVEASPTDGIVADFVNSTNAGGTIAAIKLSNADSEACDVVLGANRVGANFGSDFFISLSDSVDGSNQERFRITESGNVGIGTSTPATMLNISSTSFNDHITLTRSTDELGITVSAGQILVEGGLSPFSDVNEDLGRADKHWNEAFIYSIRSGGVLQFKSNGNNERMRITSGGNVGIGTTSPAFKTTIYSSGSTDSFPLVVGQGNAANEFVGIGLSGFIASNGAVKAAMVLDRNGIYGVGDIHFLNNTTENNTNATLSDSRLVIKKSGNVGIGTTSPYGDLHLTGNSSQNIILTNTGADGNTGTTISRIIGQARGYSNNLSVMQSIDFETNSSTWYKGDIVFKTNNTDGTDISVAASERMRITSDGNVGIGTTSPSVKLNVVGTGIQLGTSGYYHNTFLKDTTNSGVLLGGNNTSNGVGFLAGINELAFLTYGTSWGERMRIDSSGRVGMGETGMSSYDGDADDLVIKTGGNTGITLRTSSTGTGNIFFADGLTGAEKYQGTIRYFHNGNAMAFGTSATERMRIDSSGNVAIGNTSAAAKLDIRQDSGTAFRCEDASGGYFVVKHGGATGIGTSSPSYKLSVNGDIQTDFIRGYTYPNNSFLDFDDDQTVHVNVTRLASIGRIVYMADTNNNEPTTNPAHQFFTSTSDADTATSLMQIRTDGKIILDSYGSGTFTGTATQRLGVDSSGNIIELAIGSGAVDGSGTANTVTMWSDADTLTDSIMTQGTNTIQILSDGSGSAGAILELKHANNNSTDVCATINLTNNAGGYAAIEGGTTGANNTGYIAFKTDNVGTQGEKMRITGGGNVGIGTTTPDRKLEVDFTNSTYGLKLTRSDATGSSLIELANSAGVKSVMGYDAGTDGFKIGGLLSTRLLVKNNGNVGIGNTNPSRKLAVSSSGVIADFLSSITSSYVDIIGTTAQLRSGVFGGVVGIANGTGTTAHLAIDSSGNVGIGTTAPGARLQINGSTSDTSAHAFIARNSSATSLFSIRNDGRVDVPSGAIVHSGGGYANTSTNDSYFTGNLGIGTTSPSQKLHIVSTDGANIILNSNTGSENNGIWMTEGAAGSPYTNGAYLHYDGSSNSLKINTGTTSLTTKFTIDRDTGNVGIGNTNPSEKLEVTGNIKSNHIYAETYRSSRTDGEIYIQAATSNDFVSIGTEGGNNNILRVQGDGNVGIGNTSPGYKLSVSDDTDGSVNIFQLRNGDATYSQSFSYVLDTSKNLVITGASGAGGVRYNVGTNGFTIAGGNVGIGTTSPGAKLHVNGDLIRVVSSTFSGVESHNTNGTWESFIGTESGGGGNRYNSASSKHTFYNNSNAVMRIDTSGNLGIGTTSPSDKLTVNGNLSIFGNKIYNGSAANSAGVSFPSSTTRIDGYNGITFHSSTTTVGSQSERMRITNNGSVGIGTTSPSAKLEVKGTSATAADGNQTFSITNTTGGTKLNMGTVENSYGWIEAREGSSLRNLLLNPNTGNVGIGTTSPGVKFDVIHSDTGAGYNDGVARFHNNTTSMMGGSAVLNVRNSYNAGFGGLIKFWTTSIMSSVGNISFNSDRTAVNYNTTSDYRLKEDYKDFNGLDITSKIKVYDFKWQNKNHRSYGVIAHELNDVVPSAVTGEKDGADMQAVDYSKLVPLLLKSVQELKEENLALKARVSALEKN